METLFLSRPTKVDVSRQIFRLLLKLSAVFARAKDGLDFEVNRAGEAVRQSKLLQSFSANIVIPNKGLKTFSYHLNRTEEAGKQVESVSEIEGIQVTVIEGIQVTVQVTPFGTVEHNLLAQFSEVIAQQIALYVARTSVASQNALLEREIQTNHEDIALRKAVDRAKSLMVTRKGFSPEKAQEFLEVASVGAGKPLLTLATEVITALSNPHLFNPEKIKRPGYPARRCA